MLPFFLPFPEYISCFRMFYLEFYFLVDEFDFLFTIYLVSTINNYEQHSPATSLQYISLGKERTAKLNQSNNSYNKRKEKGNSVNSTMIELGFLCPSTECLPNTTTRLSFQCPFTECLISVMIEFNVLCSISEQLQDVSPASLW